MTALIRYIYSSIASPAFNEDSLPQLLKTARIANAAVDVTGMLAYVNGHFLQVIEGDEKATDALFAKINRDPRHKRVFVIVRESITSRTFGNWSMGFETLLPADVETLVGENDFFDSGSCVDAMDPSMVKTILASFRKVQTEGA